MRNNQIVGVKTRFTRVIAFGLVFLFMVSLVPARAFADEAVSSVESAPADTSASTPGDGVSSGVDSVVDPSEEASPASDSSEKPVSGEEPSESEKDNQAPKEDEKSDDEEKPKDEEEEPEALGAGNQESQSRGGVANSTIKQLVPQPDLATGALTYGYGITVAPGRNGLQPEVNLSYNSQNNEEGSIVGYGWGISIPSIERTNKVGSEKLYTSNYFTSSLSGELVDLGSGNFGSKVDNGEFLSYSLNGNVWTVKDKKGTVYKFGNTAAARQDNPADTTKVYKWMLEEIRDLNDNYIKFEYFKDGAQIYPSKIKYTGTGSTDGIFEVEFLRSSRTDINKSYKTGFLVTTSYRISEIQSKVSGTWVHKYALAYTTGNNGYRSLLSSITESGQTESGTGIITKPAVAFQYQSATAGWTMDTTTYTAPVTFDTGIHQMVDVNGDSLPDVIESWNNYNITPSNPAYEFKDTYLNTGNNEWWLNTGWSAPILFNKFAIWNNNGAMQDMGVRMVDVNGDQLLDLVESRNIDDNPYMNAFNVYRNTGAGWVLDTNWVPAIPFNSQEATHDHGTHAVDLNGDGFIDLFRSQGSNQKEQLNTGAGFASITNTWTAPVELTYPDYRIIDVNGDRLPDILESDVQSGPVYTNHAYINKGDGSWVVDDTWAPPMQFADVANTDLGVRFIDLNGDQLVDAIIAVENQINSSLGTFLNTGNGWSKNSSWDLPQTVTGIKSGYRRITDLNADGLVDFFASPGNFGAAPQNEEAHVQQGLQPDLLSMVTYDTGGSSSVTYKSSAAYKNGTTLLNPNLPIALLTVDSVTHNDGFGLTSNSTYVYEGGKYYFGGPLDRKLSGFKKVTKTDNAGNKVVTYYHQGDGSDSSLGEYQDHGSKIGKPYRMEITDSGGNKYATSISKWDRYDLGNGRNFVKLAQTINQTFDGNVSHKDSAALYAYNNANGNVIQQVDWGEVTGSDDGSFTDVGSDKFTTDVSYAANAGLNIIGLPSQETVTDQSSNKVREVKHYYDTLSFGNVNKGNETKIEQWKTGSTYIDVEKTYNSYGLVTQSLDPRNKATTYAYDTYSLYPATVTNALSQATQFTYDYSLGKPKQITDVNNLVYQTVFDGLDRIAEEKQPDLVTPATLVTKTTYAYTAQSVGNKVQKTDYLDASNAVDSFVYTDGFDRAIQTRTEMEDANTFAVSDTVYNNIEQIAKQSLPYASTGSAKTSATSNNDLYNTFGYDAMYRVTSVQNALGTITTSFDDWKTSVTDARGKVKHLYKDANDQLVRVDEVNSGSTYTTLYEYNGNGNLTKITDALSNIRNFTYDGLGRRLTAQDLHSSSDASFGTWTYSYDDSGNLTQTIDPKNQTVNYTFDDTNRPSTEDYTGQAGTEVSYAYDSCTYGVGKLCSVTKFGANTSFLYNSLGLPSREVKTIDSVNYQTDYTYNRQGHQLTIANPDSSQVKNTFNTAGQLETVQRKESTDGSFVNVVTDFDYGPHGKLTYQANANGTATTNTYDATKLYRLSRKQTSGPGGGGGGSTTVTFYPSAGDGSIYKTSVSWDSAHDATSGTNSSHTASTAYVRSGKSSVGADQIERAFLPFDTSSLPDTATITDAKLKIYVESKLNNDNDGDDWVSVVQGSQPSTTSLSTADFDLAGSINTPTEGIATTERKDITGITTGQYLIFTLNSTGQGWVSKTGATKLALREGHDVIDSAFTGSNSQFNELKFRGSEYSGTSSDPILEVTYTGAGGPPAPTVIQDTTYTYDVNGNIAQLVDASGTDTAKTVAYTYDDLNRLMSATATGVASGQQTYTYSYTYNAVGNILTRSESVAGGAAVTHTYAYEGNTGARFENPHAVTKITPSSGSVVNYTYDNNGNLTTDGTWTHTWDYGNRLTGSSKTGVLVSYAYDYGGSRVKLVTPSKTTIVASPFYSKEGTAEVKYIVAGAEAVANVRGTGATASVSFMHTDHLGSSSAITNTSGTITELSDYYPYGSVRFNQTPGGVDDRKGYTGLEYDVDTGLNYANARYYNSAIGRFISQDPVFLAVGNNAELEQRTEMKLIEYLSDPQNFNSYSYVKNNPLVAVDPNGEWVQYIIGEKNAVKLGNWAQRQYDNNSVARYAMDHPYQAGAVIGVAGGTLVAGGVVAGGGAITCGILCGGTAATTAATVGPAAATQANRATQVYNNAVNFVTNRFGFTNLPSRSEVVSVFNKWANTTMPDKTSSILYHHGRHANGRTLQQLTNNGVNVWNNYVNNSNLVRNVTNPVLGNGDLGIKINLTNGAGGIFTQSGQIVTTW